MLPAQDDDEPQPKAASCTDGQKKDSSQGTSMGSIAATYTAATSCSSSQENAVPGNHNDDGHKPPEPITFPLKQRTGKRHRRQANEKSPLKEKREKGLTSGGILATMFAKASAMPAVFSQTKVLRRRRHRRAQTNVRKPRAGTANAPTARAFPDSFQETQQVLKAEQVKDQIKEYIAKQEVLKQFAAKIGTCPIALMHHPDFQTGFARDARQLRSDSQDMFYGHPLREMSAQSLPWISTVQQHLEKYFEGKDTFTSVTVIGKRFSSTVFTSVSECNSAIRKFLTRLPEPVIPPCTSFIFAKAGTELALGNPDDATLYFAMLLQLLPHRHSHLLASLLQHWNQMLALEAYDDVSKHFKDMAPALVPVPRSQIAQSGQLLEFAAKNLATVQEVQRSLDFGAEKAKAAIKDKQTVKTWPAVPPAGLDESDELHVFVLDLLQLPGTHKSGFSTVMEMV
eukprot:m.88996 g.88996  ORF g.88996 m.88996 type:complete len:454 (-) comp12875_c0_seq1:274-1635(-)